MEITYEAIYAALEATRGTAVDPATRWMNLDGMIKPMRRRWRPEESTGLLAANRRSVTVREWSELEGKGPLDAMSCPFFMNMYLAPVTSPATPGGGTLSRTWTAARAMTSDNLKAATFYGGDPNVQQFKSAYHMGTEWKITADAATEDGAMQSIKTIGAFPSKDASDSLPSQAPGPLLIPGMMQVWVDSASAIGTTELTAGELTGVELTIPTGVTQKWAAAGATAGRAHQRIGRAKSAPSQVLTFEVPNMTIYDLFGANNGDTIGKVRVRINGPIIEGALRYYVQWDMYSPLEELGWSEIQGTNRGMQLTMQAEYDTSSATDLTMVAQNILTALP